jgi:hypothetical protein
MRRSEFVRVRLEFILVRMNSSDVRVNTGPGRNGNELVCSNMSTRTRGV